LPEIDISDILAKHDLQLTQGNKTRHRNIEEYIKKKQTMDPKLGDSNAGANEMKQKSKVEGILDTLTGGSS